MRIRQTSAGWWPFRPATRPAAIAGRLRIRRAAIRYAAHGWDVVPEIILAPQGFPAVMLATGRAFDALEVPAFLGMNTLRYAATGPVAVTPAGRWLILVEPDAHLRPALAALPGVLLHGRGGQIPAPPSRLPGGRVRWLVSPDEVGWRIPDAVAVQAGLVRPLRAGPVGHRMRPLPRAA